MSPPTSRYSTGLFAVIKQRGWSITEAGRHLGVNYATLIGIRDGHHRPGLKTMEAVERALPEYALDYLFPRIPVEEDTDGELVVAG